MPKSRKRKTDDGLLVTTSMLRSHSELLSNYANSPTLAEVLVEILNGNVLTPESKVRLARIVEILRFREMYLARFAAEHANQQTADLILVSLFGQNDELNKMLTRYNVVPQLDPAGEPPCVFSFFIRSDEAIPERRS